MGVRDRAEHYFTLLYEPRGGLTRSLEPLLPDGGVGVRVGAGEVGVGHSHAPSCWNLPRESNSKMVINPVYPSTFSIPLSQVSVSARTSNPTPSSMSSAETFSLSVISLPPPSVPSSRTSHPSASASQPPRITCRACRCSIFPARLPAQARDSRTGGR